MVPIVIDRGEYEAYSSSGLMELDEITLRVTAVKAAAVTGRFFSTSDMWMILNAKILI
jgi:hypothetical protein